MKNQYHNSKEEEHSELLKLLQKIEQLFDGTLGAWKTDPVDFKLNNNLKLISQDHSQKYKFLSISVPQPPI